jgi:hypothetical protein
MQADELTSDQKTRETKNYPQELLQISEIRTTQVIWKTGTNKPRGTSRHLTGVEEMASGPLWVRGHQESAHILPDIARDLQHGFALFFRVDMSAGEGSSWRDTSACAAMPGKFVMMTTHGAPGITIISWNVYASVTVQLQLVGASVIPLRSHLDNPRKPLSPRWRHLAIVLTVDVESVSGHDLGVMTHCDRATRRSKPWPATSSLSFGAGRGGSPTSFCLAPPWPDRDCPTMGCGSGCIGWPHSMWLMTIKSRAMFRCPDGVADGRSGSILVRSCQKSAHIRLDMVRDSQHGLVLVQRVDMPADERSCWCETSACAVMPGKLGMMASYGVPSTAISTWSISASVARVMVQLRPVTVG